MGCFATGVTVVTTTHDGVLHGMTANAVTSVSLDPMLVLICVDHSADFLEIVTKGRVFTINILSVDQEHVSRVFARKREPDEEEMRGVAYTLGRNGCPIIDGSLAYIECEVYAEYPGGDHTIFLGQAQDMGLLNEAEPLLFYMGRYMRLQPKDS